MKTSKLIVEGHEITILKINDVDYISLTDMVKKFGDDAMVYSWMRNRNTLEYIGLWEQLHNPDFKGNEFVTFKLKAGLNSFNLTPRKWIEATGAIGFISKAGRYGGGTFAHNDIAFEFGSWLNPAFKLYLLKEFQRLKADEQKRLSLDWNVHRTLAKINYRIHTDAIKKNLIPPELTKTQINFIYATEADILNMALFGKTARQWRDENPKLDGNIRDYADISQLVCLSNLENLNAHLIQENVSQPQRLAKLNAIAIQQMKLLTIDASVRQIESKTGNKQ